MMYVSDEYHRANIENILTGYLQILSVLYTKRIGDDNHLCIILDRLSIDVKTKKKIKDDILCKIKNNGTWIDYMVGEINNPTHKTIFYSENELGVKVKVLSYAELSVVADKQRIEWVNSQIEFYRDLL